MLCVRRKDNTARNTHERILKGRHELFGLAALIANPELRQMAPDLFIYRKLSQEDFDAKHGKKLKVLPFGAARPNLPRPSRPIVTPPPKPIVAVIDDAIGFLNARFTVLKGKARKTRLHNVWLQAEPDLSEIDGATSMTSGRQIPASEIDKLLARGEALDESAYYAEVNRACSEMCSANPLHP